MDVCIRAMFLKSSRRRFSVAVSFPASRGAGMLADHCLAGNRRTNLIRLGTDRDERRELSPALHEPGNEKEAYAGCRNEDGEREIELSTKQQTTAVEQVNLAIANVTRSASAAEVSTSQMIQTASELSKLSLKLAQLIRPEAQEAGRDGVGMMGRG